MPAKEAESVNLLQLLQTKQFMLEVIIMYEEIL